MSTERQDLTGMLCTVSHADGRVQLGDISSPSLLVDYLNTGEVVLVVTTLSNFRRNLGIGPNRWVVITSTGHLGWLYRYEVTPVSNLS